MNDKLTFLEERFIVEFKKSGNGTQSYKAVRPDVSLKTAGVNASKLLKKTRVQLALKEALDRVPIEGNDTSLPTRPEVLGELMDIATKAKDRIVFHSLRHTYGSWLAMQGTSILMIKELLGHRKIEMTMRYAHLIPDQKREAVLKLGERHMGKVVKLEKKG